MFYMLFAIVTISQELSVISPTITNQFIDQQNINYSIGNFGHVPYGKAMNGQLYLPPLKNIKEGEIWDLCNASEMNPSSEYSKTEKEKWIIVRRGNCPFTKKAINAQNFGAKLLIVVDNAFGRNPESIMLVDDGNGYQIDIPSILISMDDGEKIINSLYSLTYLLASIDFSIYPTKEIPDVIFGLNIESRDTFSWLTEFQPIYNQMRESINFTIYYEVQRCVSCEKSDWKSDIVDCLGGGRYCQFDPNGDKPGNGADVVREQLRQTCLWQIDSNFWWEYIDYFGQKCYKPQAYNACMKKKIDTQRMKEIEDCVENSFNGSNETQANSLLENHFNLKYQTVTVFFPGVAINNQAYRGNFEANNLKAAICSSMIQQHSACLENNNETSSEGTSNGNNISNSTAQSESTAGTQESSGKDTGASTEESGTITEEQNSGNEQGGSNNENNNSDNNSENVANSSENQVDGISSGNDASNNNGESGTVTEEQNSGNEQGGSNNENNNSDNNSENVANSSENQVDGISSGNDASNNNGESGTVTEEQNSGNEQGGSNNENNNSDSNSENAANSSENQVDGSSGGSGASNKNGESGTVNEQQSSVNEEEGSDSKVDTDTNPGESNIQSNDGSNVDNIDGNTTQGNIIGNNMGNSTGGVEMSASNSNDGIDRGNASSENNSISEQTQSLNSTTNHTNNLNSYANNTNNNYTQNSTTNNNEQGFNQTLDQGSYNSTSIIQTEKESENVKNTVDNTMIIVLTIILSNIFGVAIIIGVIFYLKKGKPDNIILNNCLSSPNRLNDNNSNNSKNLSIVIPVVQEENDLMPQHNTEQNY